MTKPQSRSTATDEQLHALSALPSRDAAPEVAARVLRISRRTFELERASGRPQWLSPLAHAWSRFVVPALLASAAALYLVWAFTITLYP
jgi:hypothetical protein